MAVTDPIADMFTRIRNAKIVKHDYVYIPFSKFKLAILKLLKEEGFIGQYEVKKTSLDKQVLKVGLKYTSDHNSVIKDIKKVSKPGNRVYFRKRNIGRTKNGFGLSIISTSKGVMTDRNARLQNVGGEVIGEVY
ncbi:30S ribosomal protein S8 [bacterium]|jgi:small subunit ribosomal protein S8|nr:30S ribosomal protein S8 [bacterium]MBT3581161.1 30S ribosomal protein S8 [bacterium]MBT4551594.1 30S ribosomal protein S8 [bacterium]MBT5988889.1 30S ribosomal protein S8 [bacterium]MBT7087804.1 30S ribosomal protein S8 [bacterium]